MITGIVGWPGAGKTYAAVRMLLDQFRAAAKRQEYLQVYANMAGLRCPESIYVDGLEDFVNVSNGLVLLDEAGVFLSSRYWQSVPREVLMSLAQVRKNGLDMIWVTQHEARIDTVLRELTSVIVRCRRFGQYSVQIHEDPLAKHLIRRKVVRLSPEVFDLYDTLEVIGTSGGSVGRGAAALSTVARRRERDEDERRRARKREREIPVVRWYSKRLVLTQAAQDAADFLLQNGISLDGEAWQDTVRAELERRKWLATWGLTAEDAPLTCTFENPWLLNHSPAAKALQREAMQQLEAMKERSKKRK